MAEEKMTLEDWLDNLCVRFMINMPPEELRSVERIFFQIEEAQWFYEDFVRPNDPDLPALNLRAFAFRVFQHCPLTARYSDKEHLTTMFEEFMSYKKRVPVRGAILLNPEMDRVLLVKGWKAQSSWSFPRGKINQNESDLDCAVREVYEETGFNFREAGFIKNEKKVPYIDREDEDSRQAKSSVQSIRLYVIKGVPLSTHFATTTRKEISKIEWFNLADICTPKNKHRSSVVSLASSPGGGSHNHKFYMVGPFLKDLQRWIAKEKRKDNSLASRQHLTDGYTSATTDAERPAFDHTTPKRGPWNDPLAEFKRVLNISDTKSPSSSHLLNYAYVDTPTKPHRYPYHDYQHHPSQQQQERGQQIAHNLSAILSPPGESVPKSAPPNATSKPPSPRSRPKTESVPPSAKPKCPDGKALLNFIQTGRAEG